MFFPQEYMAGANVITLTRENFDAEVLKAATPVLVDFWAEWCGPCKMIGPIVDELASDFDGRAKFGKVNVSDQEGIANQFGIRAVPTILIFKGGEIVEQVVGMRSKRDLTANLEKHLAD